MEQENFEQEPEQVSQFNKVTPLSKYLAMALFVLMPFIGGWIGYTYAPEKVVEVEKIVEVEKEAINEIERSESDVVQEPNIITKENSISFNATTFKGSFNSSIFSTMDVGDYFIYESRATFHFDKFDIFKAKLEIDSSAYSRHGCYDVHKICIKPDSALEIVSIANRDWHYYGKVSNNSHGETMSTEHVYINYGEGIEIAILANTALHDANQYSDAQEFNSILATLEISKI